MEAFSSTPRVRVDIHGNECQRKAILECSPRYLRQIRGKGRRPLDGDGDKYVVLEFKSALATYIYASSLSLSSISSIFRNKIW